MEEYLPLLFKPQYHNINTTLLVILRSINYQKEKRDMGWISDTDKDRVTLEVHWAFTELHACLF